MVKEYGHQDPEKDLPLYKAMYRFRQIPETRAMLEWFESELNRLDVANRYELDDVAFRQQQGGCLVLENILSMLAKSSEKVDKLAQKQGG